MDAPQHAIDAARKHGPIRRTRTATGRPEVPFSTDRQDAIVREWIRDHAPEFRIGNVPLTADARDYLLRVLDRDDIGTTDEGVL